jgi:hypothetical protein
MNPSIVAKKLVKLRKVIVHECIVCGQSFRAIKKAKTCSGACRCKLYRKKNANA